jgi:hypothetical protein
MSTSGPLATAAAESSSPPVLGSLKAAAAVSTAAAGATGRRWQPALASGALVTSARPSQTK